MPHKNNNCIEVFDKTKKSNNKTDTDYLHCLTKLMQCQNTTRPHY